MHHNSEIPPVTPLHTKWTVRYLLNQYVWKINQNDAKDFPQR